MVLELYAGKDASLREYGEMGSGGFASGSDLHPRVYKV